MVVEPPPTSTLVVAQAEVLLQILVVALDAPALMGNADLLVDRRVLRQGGQEVFARLGVAGWPLDE
jgi:phage baseplate assembly protein gpV